MRERFSKLYKIEKSFWDISNDLDLAHIPYMFRALYAPKVDNFFAHTKNPYHRLISAFLYRYKKKSFEDFCLNHLLTFNFDNSFKSNIIHFYPQFMFVSNVNGDVCVKTEKLEDFQTFKDFSLPTYNLKQYFSNPKVLEIVNMVYERDFIEFGYEKI